MAERLLGHKLTPSNQRRLANFKANKRGYWSFWIFLVLFVLSLGAEFLANDEPFLVYYDGGVYMPALKAYPETTFGGSFETAAEYKDPFVQEMINEKGWMLWPIIRYNHQTVAWDLPEPAPSAPDSEHWLGTDDRARDVLARIATGMDVGNNALPFLAAREATILGGVPARLFRISFSGELAYEIYVPSQYGRTLAEALERLEQAVVSL